MEARDIKISLVIEDLALPDDHNDKTKTSHVVISTNGERHSYDYFNKFILAINSIVGNERRKHEEHTTKSR